MYYFILPMILDAKILFVEEERELKTVLQAVKEGTNIKAIITWNDQLAEQYKAEDERYQLQ